MGFSFPPPLPTTPSSVKGVSLPLKGSRTVKKKKQKMPDAEPLRAAGVDRKRTTLTLKCRIKALWMLTGGESGKGGERGGGGLIFLFP